MKGKGEKERYTHLNAEFQRTAERDFKRKDNTEFQRIARTDKKALLSDQCKEIEENNRMRKNRDLFKKTVDIKATFHARMSMIKDRNGKTQM